MKSATSVREIWAPLRGRASPSMRYVPRAGAFESMGGMTIVQSRVLAERVLYCEICSRTGVLEEDVVDDLLDDPSAVGGLLVERGGERSGGAEGDDAFDALLPHCGDDEGDGAG